LQIQTYSTFAVSVFSANADHRSKFALIFHPQQDKHQPGILVDIFSLANGCFLSVDQAKTMSRIDLQQIHLLHLPINF
jgi:hypothetical protein